MKVKFKKRVIDIDRRRRVAAQWITALSISLISFTALAGVPEYAIDRTLSEHVETIITEDKQNENFSEIMKSDLIIPNTLSVNEEKEDNLLTHDSSNLTLARTIEPTTTPNNYITITTNMIESANNVKEEETESASVVKLSYEESPIITAGEQQLMQESNEIAMKIVEEEQKGPSDDIVEEVIEETEPVVPEPVPYYNITEHERQILRRIVEAEVTGSCGGNNEKAIQSKFRVARVILNRCKSPLFPNNVEAVVFQKRQFSPISDGRYWKVTPDELTDEAIRRALDANVPDDIPGALYFTAGGFKSKRLQFIRTDAVGHSFYSQR